MHRLGKGQRKDPLASQHCVIRIPGFFIYRQSFDGWKPVHLGEIITVLLNGGVWSSEQRFSDIRLGSLGRL